jgi:hypothetical protein
VSGRTLFLTGGLLWAACGAVASPGTVPPGPPEITVLTRGATPDVGSAAVSEWIQRSTAIVSGYFGEFPVRSLTIRLSTTEGAVMGSGRTFGYPRPRIDISLGEQVSPQALMDDWVLVHEMTHLALPAVADEQNWLAEGVATYVEGIARVQAGNMSATVLWREYVTAMPKGLPRADDQGLDHTHTWGRTYWGGALYCLEADVRIREQTHNRRGLQDALRAVAHAGGGMANPWTIEHLVSVGDLATDTSVMTQLYRKMKDAPVAPDLGALWRALGIRLTDSAVDFDDAAPLAAVRRAITQTPLPNPTHSPQIP